MNKIAQIGVDKNGQWLVYIAYYTVGPKGGIRATRLVGPDGNDVAQFTGTGNFAPKDILAGLMASTTAKETDTIHKQSTSIAGDQEALEKMSVIEKAGTNVGSKLFSNQMLVQSNNLEMKEK